MKKSYQIITNIINLIYLCIIINWKFNGFKIANNGIGNQIGDLEGVSIIYNIFLFFTLINIGSKYYYLRCFLIYITLFVFSMPLLYKAGNVSSSIFLFLLIQTVIALIFLFLKFFTDKKMKQNTRNSNSRIL